MIAQQQASGLVGAKFGRLHEVNAKYYSLRRKQLSDTNCSFIQSTPKIGVPANLPSGEIELRVIEVKPKGQVINVDHNRRHIRKRGK